MGHRIHLTNLPVLIRLQIRAMKDCRHQLRCIGCGTVITGADAAANYRCPACGDLYAVEYPSFTPPDEKKSEPLRQLWQHRRLSRLPVDQSGVWRFRELLPILRDATEAVTLREGNTPLYELPISARSLDMRHLLAKHQGMNPTASFKDTGMTAALSVARELGAQWVACASTGNTSASMAAYAARGGMRALVLIPEGQIAWGKLSQAMDYGAVTCQLQTDFDGCVRVLNDLVQRFPIALLNSVNPYRIEGQKTAAFEICEQLEFRVPDHVIVPGGNLANASALGKGFLEMQAIGLTDAVPRITVVQAEGANPFYRSMHENGGKTMQPVKAETRATAIRIGNPASWRKAADVVHTTGGWCEQVSEEEIAIAKAQIGAEGIGCEPASAVTLAGLRQLRADGRVQRDDEVVLVLTGHTLKDSDFTIDFHQQQDDDAAALHLRTPPRTVDASADAVLRVLEMEQKS